LQNEKWKMQNERENLSDRLLSFAASIIRLTLLLSKTVAGRHIAGQILRSSTSCGANYEEACGAESRADFIHKMQIVLKELRETCIGSSYLPNLFQIWLNISKPI
jgi:four helix bundle protein